MGVWRGMGCLSLRKWGCFPLRNQCPPMSTDVHPCPHCFSLRTSPVFPQGTLLDIIGHCWTLLDIGGHEGKVETFWGKKTPSPVWRQALGLLIILAQAAVVAGAFGRMAPAPKSHPLRDFFVKAVKNNQF
jgi:hypothetical protein